MHRRLIQPLAIALLALFAFAAPQPAASAAPRVAATKPAPKRKVADGRQRQPTRAKASKATKVQGPKSSASLTLAERIKFQRVERFAGKLEGLRTRIATQLAAPHADRATAQAAILRLMDTGYLRVGSEKYAARSDNPSFGASSLRKEHVSVSGDRVTLVFTGKSGVPWNRTLVDPALANAIREFMKLPGDRLFQYPTRSGSLVPVTESSIGAVLKPLGALPKDFRTYHANRIFTETLARQPKPSDAGQAKKNIETARHAAAAALNHEPETSEANYLDPKHAENHRALVPPSARGPPLQGPSGASAGVRAR